jgi:NAD(P)-dependent dehydrogenase (short-subunit alcohol dehydrogenase family)
MDLRLQGHVVLVVGGTGLIGRAVVERILTEGATPVVGARHAAELVVDAADDASVNAAVTQLLQIHGRLDALVVAAAPSARTLNASRKRRPGSGSRRRQRESDDVPSAG